MPDPHTLALFSVAVLLFAVVPGPAVFYVVTRSVSQGRLAGVVSALAVQGGNLVHLVAATLGLSAVIAASATLFTTIKYLGAAYLVYLGVKALLQRGRAHGPSELRRQPLPRIFAQGVVVEVLNPKTALFFLAFLPQFVDPARGPVALQTLVLGLLLMVISCLSDSAYALLSGTAGNWFRGNVRLASTQRYVTGGAYITLGVVAALADPKPVSK